MAHTTARSSSDNLPSRPPDNQLRRCLWDTHTHPFNGPFSRITRVGRYQKGKTNLDLLKQETVSGSSISSAICKSAPNSRQITMPVPHHSVFYRPDALPAAQPTASKHWRHWTLSMRQETKLLETLTVQSSQTANSYGVPLRR